MSKRFRVIAKWIATISLLLSISAWCFTRLYRGWGYVEGVYEFGDGVVNIYCAPSRLFSIRDTHHHRVRDTGTWGFQWPGLKSWVETKPIYGPKYVWPGTPTRYVSVDLPMWLPTLISSGLCLWFWRKPRLRVRVGCCSACNYDLTGNTSGVCPECGVAVQPGSSREEARAENELVF